MPDTGRIVRLSRALKVSVGRLVGTETVYGQANADLRIDLSHVPGDILDFLARKDVGPWLALAKAMYERGLNGTALDSALAHLEETREFLARLKQPTVDG